MFTFSEETKKIKTQLLILSGICLFIGLTKSLPEKIAILGLDLSNTPTVTGWFIFVVTLYFFLIFLSSSIPEFINHFLPSFIKMKTQNTTGNILGFTVTECCEINEDQQYSDDNDVGTPHGELREIEQKNKKIVTYYQKCFITLSNLLVCIMDFVLPVALYLTGTIYLGIFLKSMH